MKLLPPPHLPLFPKWEPKETSFKHPCQDHHQSSDTIQLHWSSYGPCLVTQSMSSIFQAMIGWALLVTRVTVMRRGGGAGRRAFDGLLLDAKRRPLV